LNLNTELSANANRLKIGSPLLGRFVVNG
jgi:hypothetical protein